MSKYRIHILMRRCWQSCGPGSCLIFLTAFKWHMSSWHLHLMVSGCDANINWWSPRISAGCRWCLTSEVVLRTCGISQRSWFCIILGKRRWQCYFFTFAVKVDVLQVFGDISNRKRKIWTEAVRYLQYLKLGILHCTKFCVSSLLSAFVCSGTYALS